VHLVCILVVFVSWVTYFHEEFDFLILLNLKKSKLVYAKKKYMFALFLLKFAGSNVNILTHTIREIG